MIVLLRKPYLATLAQASMTYGGCLNIDGCRIAILEPLNYPIPGVGKAGKNVYTGGWEGIPKTMNHPSSARHDALGRFPANVIRTNGAESRFPITNPRGVVNDCVSESGIGFVKGGNNDCGSQSTYDAGGNAARFFKMVTP